MSVAVEPQSVHDVLEDFDPEARSGWLRHITLRVHDGIGTSSYCAASRRGFTSNCLHTGVDQLIASEAAEAIAVDHACAFACVRAASTRSSAQRKPVRGIDLVANPDLIRV